ncbi:pilus assembly protein PilM [Paenibacillus sp. IB182496]|uniref:Pilus assembly protein PilM n=1 Tax=Paenibacillus sabuli TaxID=2772509 RepID=A0A927GTU1_9BACL|nr:pilus assembly protein PilM [Paenibacillus sabuli]MBD2848219.1 pilus assembly protein PilM [Paenibacillus sabuli]
MLDKIRDSLGLSRTTLGLELTDHHVKLCEMQLGGSRPRVKGYAMRALPEGTMHDGKLLAPERLRTALTELLASRKWRSRQVNFAIPSQNVIVRTVQMPDVKRSELRKLLQHELRHGIMLPFEEPHFDFVKLPHSREPGEAGASDGPKALGGAGGPGVPGGLGVLGGTGAEGTAALGSPGAASMPGAASEEASREDGETDKALCPVLLVAAPMELVLDYAELLRSVKLKLCSIELKVFALQRLQQTERPELSPQTWMAVDVNRTTCDVSIVQRDAVQITRSMEVDLRDGHAGAAAGSGVAQAAAPAGWLESAAGAAAAVPAWPPPARAREEAANPQSGGREASAAAGAQGGWQPSPSFDAACEELAAELERLLDFYRYTLGNRDTPVGSLQLTGDIPGMLPLAQRLQARMPQQIVKTHGTSLTVAGNTSGWDAAAYAVPLGLALRGRRP